ncbi:MAG: hypothetical protein PHI68_05350 [Candidatus Cloacimonetes bacterium]|nr:hypothetical protein [Candidatus Cloacimonadota bacterium]
MHKVARVIEKLPGLFVGEWNGLQIFLVPSLLHYWLDLIGLQVWIRALFSYQVHNLPITIFFLLLFYVVFILMKEFAYLDKFRDKRTQEKQTSDFLSFTFGFHQLILALGVALMIIYLLGTFFKYFYNIQFPVKKVFLIMMHGTLIIIAFYQYIINTWLSRYMEEGFHKKLAQRKLREFVATNVKAAISYTVLLFCVVNISIFLYRWLMHLVLAPLFYSQNLFQFKLVLMKTPIDVVYNTILIFFAFMMSNLLFSPLIKLMNSFVLRFHPIKSENKEPDAQNEDQASPQE